MDYSSGEKDAATTNRHDDPVHESGVVENFAFNETKTTMDLNYEIDEIPVEPGKIDLVTYYYICIYCGWLMLFGCVVKLMFLTLGEVELGNGHSTENDKKNVQVGDEGGEENEAQRIRKLL